MRHVGLSRKGCPKGTPLEPSARAASVSTVTNPDCRSGSAGRFEAGYYTSHISEILIDYTVY